MLPANCATAQLPSAWKAVPFVFEVTRVTF